MQIVENHVGRKVRAISKHGSGGAKYGFHHYAPYEPERYIEWAQRTSMRLFLGNLEDPTLEPTKTATALLVFPSAFWLEPFWRNPKKFTIDWFLDHARYQDIVWLGHPQNDRAPPPSIPHFKTPIDTLQSLASHSSIIPTL